MKNISKFPSWVFHYLKDVSFFKIGTLKQYMTIEQIDERLNNGENLSNMYKLFNNPVQVGPYNPLEVPFDEGFLDDVFYEYEMDYNTRS